MMTRALTPRADFSLSPPHGDRIIVFGQYLLDQVLKSLDKGAIGNIGPELVELSAMKKPRFSMIGLWISLTIGGFANSRKTAKSTSSVSLGLFD